MSFDMKRQSRRLLPIPPLRGNLHIQAGSESEDTPVVVILGDPEGLRSLAAVLCALADIHQETLADLPATDAYEHLHLNPGSHLGEKSARLVISRLDDQNGLLPEYYGKRLRKSRPIRELRLFKNV